MDVWTWRVRGMNWETGIERYALPCVKQIASGNLLYDTGTQLGAM